MTTTSGHPPLWRNRDYVLRLSGNVVSIIGSQVSQLAFPLLIIAVTHSPAQAGFVASLRIVPYLFLSLPAGALVDRWDRKRTMIVCDSGRALALGSIPAALWTGHLSLPQIYAVSLVEGTLFVFFSLSATAALPRIVGKEQLTDAMGQNEAMFQISSLAGPPLGGLLYGLGRAVPFLTDALSYAVSVVSLLFIHSEFQEQRQQSNRSMRHEIWEGLVWLWREPIVRTIAFLSAVAWVMLSAFNLVVILLARQQHAPSWTIGFVLAVGGVGGIVGSLLAGRLQRRFRFGHIIIACSWTWALVWPLFALRPGVIGLCAIAALLLLVWPIYNVTQMGYRIALIPDELQGRVNSAFRLIAFTGQPVGFALSGALFQSVGASATVLLLGIAPVLMAIGATLSRHVRDARPIQGTRAA